MLGDLDDLDRAIIRALQEDGRRSNVDVARAVGVAESTVRKRLDRLLNERVIRIFAWPKMEAVGLPIHATISLQVELAHVDQVANQLASLPQATSVTYTTGEYAIVVDAVFADNDELLHFLSTDIAALPGVVKTTSSHVLKRIKAPYQWLLPLPQPPTILIVDDDPDFVEITRIVLEREGFVVLSAPDGDAGLDILRRQHPDLIILDIMMNSLLEGLSATWTIRADADMQSTPILMVSSIANSEYADSFPTDEYVPVDNFLSKPVAPERLLKETRRLLNRRTQRRSR